MYNILEKFITQKRHIHLLANIFLFIMIENNFLQEDNFIKYTCLSNMVFNHKHLYKYDGIR